MRELRSLLRHRAVPFRLEDDSRLPEFEPARRGDLRAGLFFVLAGQRAAAVVDSRDQHERHNRDPRDREGNSDHGVAPFFLLGPCSLELRPFNARAPQGEYAQKGAGKTTRRDPPAREPRCATRRMAPEEGFAPSPTRGNSSPAYSLAYSGMKMVEVEGLAPPLRLGVGQLP